MTDQERAAPVEAAEGDQVAADGAATEETAAPQEAAKDDGQVETPPAEGETPPEDPSPTKARRERRKAEVQRLRREAKEATEELERVNERLARIEQAAQSQQPPRLEDFTDHDEYLAALAAHKTFAALDKRQADELREESGTHQQRAEALRAEHERQQLEALEVQFADAVHRYADFDKVARNPAAAITRDMVQVMAASDVGADVAYYLGSHPQEAAQIARMEPLDMARSIGAIEARVTAPQPRTQSTAPPPIAPVKGNATAAVDPEKMSMAEYAAARRAGRI